MKNCLVRGEVSHVDGRNNEVSDRIMIKVSIHYFAKSLNVECKMTKIFKPYINEF